MAALEHFAARLMEGIARNDVGDFGEAALTLFQLQYISNAPYRRLCDVAGVSPKAVTDWSQIPAVPTAGFKELDLTCIPVGERTTVFHSSGTTEQKPSRHYHHARSLEVYRASVRPPFGAHFAGLKLLSLTPPALAAPHSSLVCMLDMVGATFLGGMDKTGTWILDAEPIIDVLRQANEPIGVLGTGFLFVHLLDHLTERDVRLRLPEGSRVMETGGYKGRTRSVPRDQLHAQISERLGIPPQAIIGEYGMCELSSQAYARQGTYQFPSWARALIVSPETGRPVDEGETGLIRVIDLANVWSVLAVQTEDLGVRRGEGFELLGRASASEARGCSLMSA